jgi:ABC-2 type transport system permease protein
MNVYVRELKANLKSLAIWGVIVVLFVAVGISKFTAYYNNPEMLAILQDMPPAVVAALDLQAFNLTTISGFYGVMFSYFALLLSIAAAMWGSDTISKEERDKTVEFSLTLPVTRRRVVTAKSLAGLTNCACLVVITGVASVVSAAPYQPDSAFYAFLGLCLLALFILMVTFLAIGILLGCAMEQYRRAGSVAVGLLLGTYLLSIIVSLNRSLDFLKYLSPFKYFDAATMLRQSRLDVGFVLLSLAIAVASMAGAYVAYERRDLYI